MLTGYDSKHGGLAGAVLANQCDFISLVNDVADILEQHLAAEFHLQSLYRNHAWIAILAAKLQKNLDISGNLDNLDSLEQAQRFCLGCRARLLDVFAIDVDADAAQVHFIGDFARRSRAAVGVEHDAVGHGAVPDVHADSSVL